MHREVLYAFPPPVLLRLVVQKACADGARCVLVATVAVLAPHWHKLLRASVLPLALFPEGFARIRKPQPLLQHVGSFEPWSLLCSHATSASFNLEAFSQTPRTVLELSGCVNAYLLQPSRSRGPRTAEGCVAGCPQSVLGGEGDWV
jgi:hypothetical protein